MNEIPLIPRKLFFGNPDRASVQISPDGAWLSWLAPYKGVLNVWIAKRNTPGAPHLVTRDTGRGICFYGWALTNGHILYLQDKNGDENWRLYVVDVESGDTRDLTPFEGVQAQPLAFSHKFPEEIVIGLNNRNPQWHDIYRMNLLTGQMTLLLQHDRFISVLVDNDYRLRIASQTTGGGGLEFYIPDDSSWQIWNTVTTEDMMTTEPLGFDKSNRTLFMKDSRERNTSALVAVDMQTMETQVLAEDTKIDAADLMIHPTERHIQAVSFVYDRKR